MRTLQKIAFAMTKDKLIEVVKAHEERGWYKASGFRKHGYGLGCLMKYENRGEKKNASKSKSALQ